MNERIQKLFRTSEINARALLLTSQPNIFYFTGFTGHDSWAIVDRNRVIIITDGRYLLQAQQQCSSAKIVIRQGSITDAFSKIVKRHRIKSIAIIEEEITLSLFGKLKKSVEKIAVRKMSGKIIDELREIKSATEITNIKKAIKISEKSFLQAIGEIKIGMSEREFSALLEYKMKLNGAEKSAFDIIVACGRNSAKPHAEASNNKLKASQPIVIDFGVRYKGYCSDLTRTIWLGKMPEYYRRIYEICLNAQRIAISFIRDGIEVGTIDKKARDIIESKGYGKYFLHSTGHGIGLNVHENPVLSQRVKQKLKKGMIVTVEPGIYIPGKGGIRIEDDILVTEQGYEILSSLPKEIDDVIF